MNNYLYLILFHINMIIKSIKLNNIRSYKDEIFNFPKGSVLLSGDIGCGKSTVLLSIEFALFGVKRGNFSATTLLRHGEKEGYVELTFEIDNHKYIIRRILKKASKGVKQEQGFIIINDVRHDLTTEELKAKILDILGYPKSLLKKGKDYVYRFTVYTPQEEMKAILFEKPDDRLNILRKIFGIDKYKSIKENALIYIYELKSKKREYEGKTFGLNEKIKILNDKKNEQKEIFNNLTTKKKLWEEQKNILENKQKNLDELNEKINNLNKINNSISIIDTKLMNFFLLRKNNLRKIDDINNQINILEKDINKDIKDINYSKLINEKESLLEKNLTTLNEINEKISYNNAYISNSNKIISQIKNLDKCPTCKQDVNLNHKNNVSSEELKKISEFNEKIKILKENKTKTQVVIENLKENIKKLNNDFFESKSLIEKKKNINNKKNEIENLKTELIEIKKNIGLLNLEKQNKKKQIQGKDKFEKQINELKTKIDDISKIERKLGNEYYSLNAIYLENKKTIMLYEKEIEQKLNFKNTIEKINNLINWLEKFFIKVCSLIEKKVMGQIYNEFNYLFVDWFNILIEDENIMVRLDDSFSPIIEQNGFEIEINNLSGGEKTALALAYRLSLNKVINDFITNIKTKDLLILDEPTDGFSNLQLDNVKKVIEQLNIKQNIIVSHESKMESFVENIIYILKNNSISKII